jgi:hypothetical protein
MSTAELEIRYCSWCHLASSHRLVEANLIARNVYACGNCGQRTLVCMAPGCDHMARSGTMWDDNLCAEHDGSVPNLSTWAKQLEDIDEFQQVIDRQSTNFLQMPRPLGTSKLERLLSPFSSDFSALEHFSIRKVRGGSKHAVVFINGFLSQAETDISDWTESTMRYFGKATWYHLDWEATLHPQNPLKDDLFGFAAACSLVPARQLSATSAAYGLVDAAAAWHLSMKNAEIAGRLLANAITRTPGWRFTLAGHSLGARVVHFALRALAGQAPKCVENAYLLGAAVGGGAKDDACWTKAASAVRGRIFNCYSLEDKVLQNLYQGANAMMSKPAGYHGIHLVHDKIVDFDCSALVDSHMNWKPVFGEIISQLRKHL